MIYYITEQFLKNKTPITQNVDAKDLAPFMEMTVRTYIQPILGYNFNNELLEKFNDETLSPIETDLVEFIQFVVAFYATYDAIPSLTFRISNKGIQSQFGDYQNSEGVATVEYLRNNMLKFARVHESNLRAFLDLNKDQFSTYLATINEQIEAPDKGQTRNSTSWL
jgi:sulfur relay (sulfurtransferase) DsrC/TusE family protein